LARRSEQPLLDILQWHPRDVHTWLALDMAEAEEARFAQMHAEHSEQMGR
jgi:hypothetical protein